MRLAKTARSGAEQVRNRARLSIDAAIECGRLLCLEKESVDQQNDGVPGLWIDYFRANFERFIPYRTARHWMRLSRIALDGRTPEANVLRIGVLSLGVLPRKIHPKIDGDHSVPRFVSHLSFVNRFDSWRRTFAATHAARDLTEPERAQLRADFRPVIEFLSGFGLMS